MKIKRGDFVRVITGKFRDVEGQIVKVFPRQERVCLEAIKFKKHSKPNQKDTKGQIKEIYRPIHFSNVMLLDKSKKRLSRIGFRFENGKKVRYGKKKGFVFATK